MSHAIKKAVYTKEDGSSSNRVLIAPDSDTILVLDVTTLSDSDRELVAKANEEYQADIKKAIKESVVPLADRLRSHGINPAWRSFKRSGLVFTD